MSYNFKPKKGYLVPKRRRLVKTMILCDLIHFVAIMFSFFVSKQSNKTLEWRRRRFPYSHHYCRFLSVFLFLTFCCYYDFCCDNFDVSLFLFFFVFLTCSTVVRLLIIYEFGSTHPVRLKNWVLFISSVVVKFLLNPSLFNE